MNQVRSRGVVQFGLAALLMLGVAFAQSDFGSISGFAKDPSGATVPKAKVTVRNEGTHEERTALTNDSGYYVITNLPPSFYTVVVEAAGFKKSTSEHVKLDANSTLAVDASLVVGAATESIEVAAQVAVLQTESGSVQNEVTGQQIQDQELNGRNPVYMAQFLPGMRSGSTLGDFNFAVGAGVPFQVNGARAQDTIVMFDGAPAVRTRANGAVVGVADVDAVQEIQVMTADYSAEYGRAAGGQMRVIGKSGTSDFHGTGYEYFRNSALNANTWSRNLSPTTNFTSPFRYNDPGFTIGGPVWFPGLSQKLRQKLFFFVAEDWIRYRYTDTQTQAVPTLLMRQGNFSELLSPNPWYSGTQVIYDPATCQTKGAASCVPFPDNVIPTSRLSPNGVGIMNAYPLPTPGSGRHAELDCAGRPPDQPAQGEHELRYQPRREGSHLGAAHRCLLLRVSAVRPGLGRDRQILQPAEPDQHRFLVAHHQPHADQRGAHHV